MWTAHLPLMSRTRWTTPLWRETHLLWVILSTCAPRMGGATESGAARTV